MRKTVDFKLWIPLIVFLVALGIRLIPIVTGLFFFHFDSARDWLWIRDLVLHKPTLVGPWSSLQGVFYGPLTYYLLAIFFWLFNGNPVGGSVYALVVNLTGLVIFWHFLYREIGQRVAVIGLVLLAFSALSLKTSTFIFQSNPSLLLGVIILPMLYRLSQRKLESLPWLFFVAGLGVHTNLFWPAFLLPYILFVVWQLKLKLEPGIILKSLALLLLPLLPQILFEFRHEWLQTKSLLAFVNGENPSLGENLSLIARIIDRAKLFLSVDYAWGLLLLLVIRLKMLEFVKLLLLMIGFFFVGAVIFPAQFKIWYLYGLVPVLALLTALALQNVKDKFKLGETLVNGLLIVIVTINVINFLPMSDATYGKNMKLYRNQKQVVDKVLAMAKDSQYGVYTYTEPIYDYPYQYIFWWTRRNTGQGPIKYGYLPEKYDYVLNKRLYDSFPEKVQTIFLIMEKDNPASDYRHETWLKEFYEYEAKETVELDNGVRIERRAKVL